MRGVTLLHLEAKEFRDLTRWRWVLADESGAFVADHEVRLDAADWQLAAFADLPFYLGQHKDDARIVGEVGEWIGARVFGAIGPALAARRPAVVRVVVREDEALSLLTRPLELAHVNGRPLSVQGVTLVMDVPSDVRLAMPADDPVRVLGLFSVPTGSRALNLRRERQELVRLVQGIAALGRSAQVRVVQYGVTRDALRDVLAEGAGWDIIHVSGHGRPGELVLEDAAGSADVVDAELLAELLAEARGRVRLVTLSACWSAATAAGEQRKLLGLPDRDDSDADEDGTGADDTGANDTGADDSDAADTGANDTGADDSDAADTGANDTGANDTGANDTGANDTAAGDQAAGDQAGADDSRAAGTGAASGTLATLLAGRLGCAVLAMRYKVADDFAVRLSRRLYDLLLEKGQPLPRAVGITLRELEDGGELAGLPALSAATPALFAPAAADLRLTAPRRPGPLSYAIEGLKMARFPAQAPRFVGRVAEMARSSAALATGSGVPGVLLHGVPGTGKTAAAVELAYGHEHAFDRLTWYHAPAEGMDIGTSLADFAATLESSLPGFTMQPALETTTRLDTFLPQLTEMMDVRRVLVVIDGAESLLTGAGQWRDERWGQVAGALCGHAGLSRLVLTSRRVPVTGLGDAVRVLVGPLSRNEALLQVGELPRLSALGQGKVAGLDPDAAREALAAQRLAWRAIERAGGHPGFLERAEIAAASPQALAAFLESEPDPWDDPDPSS